METTYVIAEVGSVHDGSFGNAGTLIETAADCGVDAVKFQTHIAEAETLRSAPEPSFFKAEPRFEYFERTAFSESQWVELRRRCHEAGVQFISSPFSIEAVELLERVGVDRYKIPSGEVTNHRMLEVVAQTGRPVILSSGMSSWGELDDAVEVIRRHSSDLVVLQCSSQYPCPPEQVGLNVMLEIRDRYECQVGLSDHTRTNYASLAAVALGARTIEKHLTFSRRMYGSDASHSIEPDEFTELVEGIRETEIVTTVSVDKDDIGRYEEMKTTFEKSIVSVQNIERGAVVTERMIGAKKPGIGIPASEFDQVIGHRATRFIPAGEILEQGDIDWEGSKEI